MTNPDDIRLVETCGACPEQYNAFLADRLVGYLRLRHGCFRVDAGECGGPTVLAATPRGDGFFEPEERGHYLSLAKVALAAWVDGRPFASETGLEERAYVAAWLRTRGPTEDTAALADAIERGEHMETL